jgi:hypothetical protein
LQECKRDANGVSFFKCSDRGRCFIFAGSLLLNTVDEEAATVASIEYERERAEAMIRLSISQATKI